MEDEKQFKHGLSASKGHNFYQGSFIQEQTLWGDIWFTFKRDYDAVVAERDALKLQAALSKPMFSRRQLEEELAAAKAENEKLKLQSDFLKEYYNPKSLAFKNMIDAFVTLPKDKQQKLIDLSKSLAALNETTKELEQK